VKLIIRFLYGNNRFLFENELCLLLIFFFQINIAEGYWLCF
jgi:hypothetical protein